MVRNVDQPEVPPMPGYTPYGHPGT
jgi:hypothetical protein